MKSHSAVFEMLLLYKLRVSCFILFDPREVCIMK